MELELKAERGGMWVEEEVHLWHLTRESCDTALCDLRLDHAPHTWPLEQWGQVFPERLCPVCRRRYAELLPVGGARPLGFAGEADLR